MKLSVSWGRVMKRCGQEALTDNLLCSVVKWRFWWSFCLRGSRTPNIRPAPRCYLGRRPVRSSLPFCGPVPAVTVWAGRDKVITRPPSLSSRWKSLLPSDFAQPHHHHHHPIAATHCDSRWLLTRIPSPLSFPSSSGCRATVFARPCLDVWCKH